MKFWRVAFLCVAGVSPASAQQLPFSGVVGADTAGAISTLASKALAVYRDDNHFRYLDNLFRLQLAAGRYAEAATTLRSLGRLEPGGDSRQPGATLLLYSIFARAKASRNGMSFDSAFQRIFREVLTPLDDKTSWLVERPLLVYQLALKQSFDSALQQQKKKKSAISLADALRLIRAHEAEHLIAGISPLAAPIVDEDNRRRYIIETDIPVKPRTARQFAPRSSGLAPLVHAFRRCSPSPSTPLPRRFSSKLGAPLREGTPA